MRADGADGADGEVLRVLRWLWPWRWWSNVRHWREDMRRGRAIRAAMEVADAALAKAERETGSRSALLPEDIAIRSMLGLAIDQQHRSSREVDAFRRELDDWGRH